jgi:hypothetical protein
MSPAARLFGAVGRVDFDLQLLSHRRHHADHKTTFGLTNRFERKRPREFVRRFQKFDRWEITHEFVPPKDRLSPSYATHHIQGERLA